MSNETSDKTGFGWEPASAVSITDQAQQDAAGAVDMNPDDDALNLEELATDKNAVMQELAGLSAQALEKLSPAERAVLDSIEGKSPLEIARAGETIALKALARDVQDLTAEKTESAEKTGEAAVETAGDIQPEVRRNRDIEGAFPQISEQVKKLAGRIAEMADAIGVIGGEAFTGADYFVRIQHGVNAAAKAPQIARAEGQQQVMQRARPSAAG